VTQALDIVIVSYNTRDDLVACLASLEAARPSGRRQITVVDNASADGSGDVVRARFPAVRLIALDRNVGFGAANNVALTIVEGPLVLLLNSDTLVPPGAIDELVARLIATGAAAAGPRLIDADGRPEISFGRALSPFRELVQRVWVRLAASSLGVARRAVARHVGRERDVDWVTGACLLARLDAVRAAGLFDERYFLYEEDVDLCAALRARGGRVLFTPHAQVVHRRGRSVARAGGPGASHYDRSHLAYYEKHAPGWAPWLRLWLRVRGRRIR
jgi:GT2 family glycosyltransferase